MIADPWFWALALPAVALTGISKGALGGGASIAVPLMALAIPPAQAAAIMLPALCLMDLAGIRAYLGKWDARVMRIIVPAGLVGALTFRHLSEHWMRILLGVISLGFLAWSYYPKKRLGEKPPGAAAGWFWGTLSGFTSFVTHAGGPPILVYLLPLRLEKAAFVATSLVFFTALNYAKVIPYVALGLFDTRVLLTSTALVPLGVGCIYVGQWLQNRINPRTFYRLVHVLLLAAGLGLLYDGLSAL